MFRREDPVIWISLSVRYPDVFIGAESNTARSELDMSERHDESETARIVFSTLLRLGETETEEITAVLLKNDIILPSDVVSDPRM